MKLSYRSRLFLNFLLLFALFALLIITFQVRHERAIRRQALEERFSDYVRLCDRFLTQYAQQYAELSALLPDSLRLTVLDLQGNVVYDSQGGQGLENHALRTEVQQSRLYGQGNALRNSKTMGCYYYYYAERFSERYLRVALPYTASTQHLLSVDSLFLFFLIALFTLSLLAILYLSGRMGRSITRLREFSRRIALGQDYGAIRMPDNELGEVGKDIMHAYQMLQESNAHIRMEQDKLLQHFMHTAEGIALFDTSKRLVYSNTHFLRYINILRDEPTINLDDVLSYEQFQGVEAFVDGASLADNLYSMPTKEVYLSKGRLHYLARVLIFPDRSFEISLSDVTRQEESRKLKQEMTSNIAHELRTPVSSIQGYVETLLRNEDLPPEQRQRFLTKGYSQCERLGELIKNITLISTLEEDPNPAKFAPVNLRQQFDEVAQELQNLIEANGSNIENTLPDDLVIDGNAMQLYALWRNLLENSLRYAGRNTALHVGLSARDQKYLYLVYWDNGTGVEEQHLERIFERFYRVDGGRTRLEGGSGLGLSIVKNTVLAHGGKITAKRHQPQGLEFVFTLQIANN